MHNRYISMHITHFRYLKLSSALVILFEPVCVFNPKYSYILETPSEIASQPWTSLRRPNLQYGGKHITDTPRPKYYYSFHNKQQDEVINSSIIQFFSFVIFCRCPMNGQGCSTCMTALQRNLVHIVLDFTTGFKLTWHMKTLHVHLRRSVILSSVRSKNTLYLFLL